MIHDKRYLKKREAWLEKLKNPYICHLDIVSDIFGGDDAPAPDPAVGEAAKQNAAVARESLAFNKKVYEENKPRQAKSDELATKVVQDQLDISKQNQTQAADQWDRFKKLFAPVEEQTVADATKIDSTDELDRAAGAASGAVQAQFDNAAAQRARNQAAMGINPNSGRAMAMDRTAQLGLAAAKADAANNARLVARDRGIALRAGVANFGRNMPNTAANAYGTAITGGNSAMGNQNSTMATSNANAGQMNQGFNTAINGGSSAMQGLNQQYGNQINAWNAEQQRSAASSAGFGNMVGMLGSAYIRSSKEVKNKTGSVNDEDTLNKVIDLPVDSWKYKDGVEDEGEHIGAYAEDVREKFGDKAAPGGKMIDMISMHGITLSAVKGLSKQVDKLEKKVASVAARGIRGA